MTIDTAVDNIIENRTPQRDAVNALIRIARRKSGEVDSDVEIKTDLTADDASVHTAVDVLGGILDMNDKQFTQQNFISQIVNKKERKLISKDRQSRKEIVDVARNPDMPILSGEEQQKRGLISRFFTPRK